MSAVRVRVIVSGRVQGVFFRESTRQCAERLGLAGWVRNLPDGRVEAQLEGPAVAVEQGLAFVREGPGMARVTGVEEVLREAIPAVPREGFRVRR